MRLGWSCGKYSTTYRAIKTIRVNGKNKTIVIKTFGSDKYICETYGVTDARAWAMEQVRIMNEAEQEESAPFFIELNSGKDLAIDEQRCFNGGYLFLQDIYYELGLHKICRAISRRHPFEYDLNDVLSRLIYTRILYPSSKRSSFEDAKKFIEQPAFELHDIYRALSVLAEESDYIQSRLFRNSVEIGKRRTGVIYYDCTNYYFETEQAEDDKQYGKSKEHRPLPIVSMGLFMDADGIPISFGIMPGNHNEQTSMIPLEKKLIDQFDVSRFIVCTDSGLSSATNRYFNYYEKADGCRYYITVQSLKNLKTRLRDWALSPTDWHIAGAPNTKYDLRALDEEKDKEKIFYKAQWIKEPAEITLDNGATKKIQLEQTFIVSFSLKYKDYQREIRKRQIERAEKIVSSGESSVNRKDQNSPRRLISTVHTTDSGEVAEGAVNFVDEDKIAKEEQYDGFYAVCTNLDDSVENILEVNKRRWQIEQCFRILKTDLQARPVYVKRKDRIMAHFITCFVALVVCRYLERKLDNKYSIDQIISALQEMNFMKYEGKGYQPTYTRTELTDALHAAFGFTTSKEIVPVAKMRNIMAITKK